MKIEYIKGDLFLTDKPIIVHGCNTLGTMGAGVAKQVKERYPKAYQTYMEDARILGTISTVLDHDRKIPDALTKVIVNAITQAQIGFSPKKYVSYDAIMSCMEEVDSLHTWLKSVHYTGEYAVAMPMIGAGLGGGDWNIIEAIIEEKMKNLKPYVYVY